MMNLTTISSSDDAAHPQALQGTTARRGDQRLFKLLFLVSFPVFLLLTLIARWVPATGPIDAARGEGRHSLVSEAADAACSTIAIVLNV